MFECRGLLYTGMCIIQVGACQVSREGGDKNDVDRLARFSVAVPPHLEMVTLRFRPHLPWVAPKNPEDAARHTNERLSACELA